MTLWHRFGDWLFIGLASWYIRRYRHGRWPNGLLNINDYETRFGFMKRISSRTP
jgi:hypothetical protein